MRLTTNFKNYKKKSPGNITQGLSDQTQLVDSLQHLIPSFSILRSRMGCFNTSQNDEINRRVYRIHTLIYQEKGKESLFDAILDHDCVERITQKLDNMIAILEGQSIESALYNAKEKAVRDLLTCFVNSTCLRDLFDFATVKTKWFVNHTSVQTYHKKAIFGLPFNLDRAEPHLVNTFVNYFENGYSLTKVDRNIDHHTIAIEGTGAEPLSLLFFERHEGLVSRSIYPGQNDILALGDIQRLLDDLYSCLRADYQQRPSYLQYASIAEYAGTHYKLHRCYSEKLDSDHTVEDVKAALLLHLFPYLATRYMAEGIQKESFIHAWLSDAATALMNTWPAKLDDSSSFPKLNKALETMPIQIPIADAAQDPIRQRLTQDFSLNLHGQFTLDAKNVMGYDYEGDSGITGDYKLFYKAHRHALLTIVLGLTAVRQGLLDISPEAVRAQIAFLVWQGDPEKHEQLESDASEPWGVLGRSEQNAALRQVKNGEREAVVMPPAQKTNKHSVRLWDSGMSNPETNNSHPKGLAVAIITLANSNQSYRHYHVSRTKYLSNTLTEALPQLSYSARNLLCALEYAYKYPNQQDFAFGNPDQQTQAYLRKNQIMIATYLVVKLAECKPGSYNERWLRELFVSVQQIIGKSADQNIDRRVRDFFDNASNRAEFARSLDRPLTQQNYRHNSHFFSMSFDSFKKIATAVQSVKRVRNREGIWAKIQRLLVWILHIVTFRRPIDEVTKTYGFFNSNRHLKHFQYYYKGIKP